MLKVNQLIGFGASSAKDPYYISSSQYSSTAPSTLETLAWTHTTTADTTCIVIGISASRQGGSSVGTFSADFNGVSASELNVQSLTSSQAKSSLFYLLDPPIGTFTMTVNVTLAIERFMSASAVNLGGVNNVASFGVNGTTSATSSLTVSGTTTKKAVLVGESFFQHTGSTVVTLSSSAPATMALAQSASNTSNSVGKRASIFYSTLQAPGTFNATVNSTSSSLSFFTWCVGAFTN